MLFSLRIYLSEILYVWIFTSILKGFELRIELLLSHLFNYFRFLFVNFLYNALPRCQTINTWIWTSMSLVFLIIEVHAKLFLRFPISALQCGGTSYKKEQFSFYKPPVLTSLLRVLTRMPISVSCDSKVLWFWQDIIFKEMDCLTYSFHIKFWRGSCKVIIFLFTSKRGKPSQGS